MRIHAAVDGNVVEVSGHEQHPEIRLDDRQMFGQLPAVHARHHHIGQQEIDVITLLRGREAGFDPFFLDHLVAGLE